MRTASLISWIGGAVIAVGVFLTCVSLMGWAGGGSYTTLPYLYTVLILAIAGWAIRRRTRSPALRSGIRAVSWSSVPLLLYWGATSNYIDTKTASMATQMKAYLSMLASRQEEFRKDSGRYFVTPPEDFRYTSAVVPRGITLTRDGWTASVSHLYLERTCSIFVGTTAIAPAVREHEPACTRLPFRIMDHLRGIVTIIAGALMLVLAHGRSAPGLDRMLIR